MSSDLLSIGSSGVLAQQKLLWTTSNNISNINTQGYTRQSTTLYTNTTGLGVGMSQTNRLWYEIFQIVKENCTGEYSGATPQDDIMERLLTARRGK